MFVTSTAEVLFPSADKLISVTLHQSFDFFQLLPVVSVIFGRLKIWLKPEFRLAITRYYVSMPARLVSQEEKETISLFSEYCGTHPYSSHIAVY